MVNEVRNTLKKNERLSSKAGLSALSRTVVTAMPKVSGIVSMPVIPCLTTE